MPALLEEALTRSAIGAFLTVHRTLGFGYREFIYALALERELLALGHRVAREVAVMVYYRGEPLARQTLDMIVDDKLIIEIKAAEHLHPHATLQLFSYLCSTNLEVGLLFHFGREAHFHRVICENRLKAHHGGRRTTIPEAKLRLTGAGRHDSRRARFRSDPFRPFNRFLIRFGWPRGGLETG